MSLRPEMDTTETTLTIDVSAVTVRGLKPAVAMTTVLVEQMMLIHELRIPEGSSVTICASNADFDGPNDVIMVSDDWTNWEERRFEGDSLLDCLRKAVAARPS